MNRGPETHKGDPEINKRPKMNSPAVNGGGTGVNGSLNVSEKQRMTVEDAGAGRHKLQIFRTLVTSTIFNFYFLQQLGRHKFR